MDIEQKVLSGHKVSKFSGPSNKGKGNVANKTTMFCKAFQTGKCTRSSPHNISLNGKKYLVSHICAASWLVDKEKSDPLKLPVIVNMLKNQLRRLKSRKID